MDKDQLLALLELEDASEFLYFEHFSTLMESEAELDYDLFYELLEQVPAESLSELTDHYFEDIMQGVPDDDMNLYTLFQEIRHTLHTLASASDQVRYRALFIEELFRFRNWFLLDGLVNCTGVKDRSVLRIPVIEALTLYRLEKLSMEKYEYDFSDALDYEIDEYTAEVVQELDEEALEEDHE